MGIVRPPHIIVAAEFCDALDWVLPQLHEVRPWARGAELASWPRIDGALPTGEVGGACPAPALSDCSLHMYTSGSTGLPKAVGATTG